MSKILCFILVINSIENIAQLVVNTSTNHDDFIENIVGQGVIISNVIVNCPNLAIGEFTSTSLPISEGVLLSTGNVSNAVGPNSSVSTSQNHGFPGDFQLDALAGSPTYDACSIEFDFIPQCENLNLKFLFASEEYDEYINREYNDVFAIYISGQDPNNLATPYNNLNLALVPLNTTPISVNTINNGVNSNYYTNNDGGAEIEFDGYTSAISTQVELIPCESYHLKIAIADVTDGIFDSGIFIESNSITCNNVIYDVEANVTNLKENCTQGSVTFCRNGDITTPKTFNLITEGTATNGTDYIIPSSITIPANQECFNLNIPYITDNLIEGTETIKIIYQTGFCPFNDTIEIEIKDAFTIDAGQNKTTCSSDSVQIGLIANNIHTLTWSSPNDLNNASIAKPTIISNTITGNIITEKYYTLTAIRNDGCIAIDSLKVTFKPSPELSFQLADECQNESFTITNTSVLNDTSGNYQWDFNNGNVSFLKSPTLSYNTHGNYEIKLIASNSMGCADTLSDSITIYPLPIVNFQTNNQCINSASCLNNNTTISSGNIISWVWNFGDNSNLETQENPCHVYNSFGNFQVELIASSDKGCIAFATKSIRIYPKPILSFANENHCLGTVYEINNYTTIPSGSISSYQWDFGDNNSSILKDPIHVYSSTGNYDISLVASSDEGCIDSLSSSIEVFSLPIANFSSNVVETCENSCISFSSLNNTDINNYKWIFSNGYFQEGVNVTQCFENEGSFNVSLEIEDINECKDTINKLNYIEVYPSPEANFSPLVSPSSMYDPFIEIENKTIDNCSNWLFNFGDGVSEESETYKPIITHQYKNDGDFMITQIVSNDFGCYDTLTLPISLKPIKTLFIPNSFTPNNDGNNDFFIPIGVNISPFKLEIFNRWGAIIFTTTTIDNPWDGTHKGKASEADAYIYKLTYGNGENTFVKTGTVTLIR